MPVYGQRERWVVKTPALLSQATPTQNTWYTVLSTSKYIRLLGIYYEVLTTGETLEVEITINGVKDDTSQAATAATGYDIRTLSGSSTSTENLTTAAAAGTAVPRICFEGSGLLVRIRKTSASGTGTINCRVLYMERE